VEPGICYTEPALNFSFGHGPVNSYMAQSNCKDSGMTLIGFAGFSCNGTIATKYGINDYFCELFPDFPIYNSGGTTTYVLMRKIGCPL
jgi:hypothetical protein